MVAIDEKPEDGEQPLVLGERELLLLGELARRRSGARHARHLIEVELDGREHLLDAREREGAAGEHALHARLGEMQAPPKLRVRQPARAHAFLQRFDEAARRRHATNGIR